MNPALTLILVLLVIAAVGAVIYLYMRDRRTKQLRARFGPEYSRVINETGDRRKAEASLERRAERVKALAIHPLQPAESARFSTRWDDAQTEFVDNPRDAVSHADTLLEDVMKARGYPISDFDRRSADLSVHYPRMVQNYRTAHEIALKNRRGEAGTEDLRQAMICYRTLFNELTADTLPQQRDTRPQPALH